MTKTTVPVPLPDPDEVQEKFQAAMEKFRANRGLYITIGALLLLLAVGVIAGLSMTSTDSASAFTPLWSRYDSVRQRLVRDLSAQEAIAELESYLQSIRGTEEEGLGLWLAALSRYGEAWAGDKFSAEDRRPHLEKALGYLEELGDQRFDDLLLAKRRWFSLSGDEPIRQLRARVEQDLAWVEDNVRPEPEPAAAPVAVIRTDAGDIYLKFFTELAPKHVESFLTLARAGAYNGTAFHFASGGNTEPTGVMAGDPYTWFFNDPLRKEHLLNWGSGGTGYGLPPEEARFRVHHRRGVVTSQRTERADWDNAVQFQILVDTDRSLDRVHTPFAQVVEGMDVVDKIARRRTASQHTVFKDDPAFASIFRRDLLVEPAWIQKVIVYENGSALEHAFPLAAGEEKLATLKETPAKPVDEGYEDPRRLAHSDDPEAASAAPGTRFPFPAGAAEDADPKGDRREPD